MPPIPSETASAVADSKYRLPRNESGEVHKFAYGTAGFRTTASLLTSVGYRVGVFAALRSRANGNAAVGVMVTASHNPPADNGIKIIDSGGGMLEIAWEKYATTLANCDTGAQVAAAVDALVAEKEVASVDVSSAPSPVVVHVGIDTRPSGPEIAEAVIAGIRAAIPDAYVVNHGVVTTPILHFAVAASNADKSITAGAADPTAAVKALESATGPTAYLRTLLGSADALFAGAPAGAKRTVVIDCANGVGAIYLDRLLSELPKYPALQARLDIVSVNTDTANVDALNVDCGGDFSQKTKKPGVKVAEAVAKTAHKLGSYAFDGDADRIVAFSGYEGGSPAMLDGDRIIVLLACFLRELFGAEKLAGLDVGVVQTAYANGGSTSFIKGTLGLPVECTATGVKFLHPAAHKKDIGLYFEANGHGTALFSQKALTSGALDAARVKQLMAVLSQFCGDAIGDMLACELALAYLGWDFGKWLSCYNDLPSVQLKVTVPDPSVITNTPDQTKALTPDGLQAKIDELVKATGDANARSFVRPSGTEPIVRVYAEASTNEAMVALGDAVKAAVQEFCK